MRSIRISKTALDQLNALLAQGIAPFGAQLVADKRGLVYDTIRDVLANYPAIKGTNEFLGLRVYAVKRTPFVLLYDFDDAEIRVHFVFHRNASLTELDPRSVAW